VKCKVLLILMLLAPFAQGQSTYFRFIASTVSTSSGINLQNSGSIYQQISWTKSGTLATCQVQVDSSADGVTWNSGDIVASQACTSNGNVNAVHFVSNYSRVNVTAISGGGSVTVVFTGYTTNPVPSGGSVTSIATTSPITGGTITTTGTIACATCAIGPGSSTANHVAEFSGTDGVTLKDGGTAGTGTVTNTGGSLTSNAVVLGAGTNDTKVSTGITTNGASELDLGVSGTSGVLGLNGSTSGKATLTAPAVAGTSTNAISSSNVLQVPVGSISGVGIGFGSATLGLYGVAGPVLRIANGADIVGFFQSSGLPQIFTTSAGVYEWTSGTLSSGGDTGLSRVAADVVGVGNSAQGDTTGKVKAAGYMSVGTTFTSSGGCTEGTLVGGATAGKFTTSGSTGCTTVITMGNSATAPNGWSCTAIDLTTVGDVTNPHQTATTTTTATIATGTIVTSDVIQFSCIGY
jgi:hypothetical protein